MKIYFDKTMYDECITPCPYGVDCKVGSIFCEQCRHNMYTHRGMDVELAIFGVGEKLSLRSNDYVECSHDGDVTLWKLIKKFFYKLFND